jgi:hypothetical protein
MSLLPMKPVRAIRDLTNAELVIRDIARAEELRLAAHARVDAHYIERVKVAMSRMSAGPEATEGIPLDEATGS